MNDNLAANSLLEDVRNLELPEGEAFPFSFWVHLGDVGCKYIRADLAAERERELWDSAITVTASLVAASSLLERGGKKAAPSDKMFEQMLLDYKKAVKRGQDTLAKHRSKS